MNDKIKFNRILTDEEVFFWNNFMEKIPVVSNSYISGLYEVYEMYPKMAELRNAKAMEHINASFSFSTNEELVAFFKNDPDTPHCRQKFEKAITIYSDVFPSFTPFQLMFLTIYCSTLKDMNLKIENDGVKLLFPKHEDLTHVTYCPQLAILGDLMNGRMKSLDSSFKFLDVEMDGTVVLNVNKPDSHSINVSKGKPTSYLNETKPSIIVSKEKNYISEFTIDAAGVNTNNYDIISPLGDLQKDFNSLLETYNLTKELKKEDTKNKRAKI